MAMAVNADDSKPIRSSAAVDFEFVTAVVVVAVLLAAVILGGEVVFCC